MVDKDLVIDDVVYNSNKKACIFIHRDRFFTYVVPVYYKGITSFKVQNY